MSIENEVFYTIVYLQRKENAMHTLDKNKNEQHFIVLKMQISQSKIGVSKKVPLHYRYSRV